MRYFMTILPDAKYKDQSDTPPELMDAMGPWMERQLASGALISTAGLQPAATGKRLTGHSGSLKVTDGPFSEAKEVVGGYAVIEAPDQDAAVAMAAEFLQLHIDNGMPAITLEVRAIEGGINY